ncbi:MAG: NERD domain-containing protein [Gammaproteobacteria bacterium]|nr:NERD domain-containing protein [Gammaproteobacteria bacterium]
MAMAFCKGLDIILRMDASKIIDPHNLQSDMVAYVIIALAIMLIFFINRRHLVVRFREWCLQRSLNRIGCEQMRDLICPDGLESHYSIDRLALTRDAILLISYKPYVGNIYCAERISEWTQVIEQKSFKFENPLFEMENQLTALRVVTGDIKLQGFLFFSHSVTFPKGHPNSVLQPDSIPERFMGYQIDTVNADVRQAWERLKTLRPDDSMSSQLGVKT